MYSHLFLQQTFEDTSVPGIKWSLQFPKYLFNFVCINNLAHVPPNKIFYVQYVCLFWFSVFSNADKFPFSHFFGIFLTLISFPFLWLLSWVQCLSPCWIKLRIYEFLCDIQNVMYDYIPLYFMETAIFSFH